LYLLRLMQKIYKQKRQPQPVPIGENGKVL
jgi:hypothetical protein